MCNGNLITVLLRHPGIHRLVEDINFGGCKVSGPDALLEEEIQFGECPT